MKTSLVVITFKSRLQVLVLDSNQLDNNSHYMCFFASSKMDAALFSQGCVAVATIRPFVAMDAALSGWDKSVSMMLGN